MPTPAYLTVEGQTQGPISQGAFTADSVGNIFQEGHEDEIFVQSFQHNVTLPRDPQSGQPSGQRVHKPFEITKCFDKASPLLMNALATGEVLTKVELKFYRTSAAGKQEHFYTITLHDALIVDIDVDMPNAQDESVQHLTQLEKVAFSYLKIDWTHEKAGTSGSDSWRKPVAA